VLKWANVLAHVCPPSKVYAVTRPCAPPFDQRSCWKTATMLFAFVGLTATQGSTSALT
jgi:hypothetical protein